MKKYILIFTVMCSTISFAQFKNDPKEIVDVKKGIISNPSSSFILGFINPENFSMNHSVSMSYSAIGNQSLALGVYTNHMALKFNDSFHLEVDASIVNSPYSTFGDKFNKQINGLYLSRAQLNYQPSDKFLISIQYSKSPYGYYDSYNPFMNRRLGLRNYR